MMFSSSWCLSSSLSHFLFILAGAGPRHSLERDVFNLDQETSEVWWHSSQIQDTLYKGNVGCCKTRIGEHLTKNSYLLVSENPSVIWAGSSSSEDYLIYNTIWQQNHAKATNHTELNHGCSRATRAVGLRLCLQIIVRRNRWSPGFVSLMERILACRYDQILSEHAGERCVLTMIEHKSSSKVENSVRKPSDIRCFAMLPKYCRTTSPAYTGRCSMSDDKRTRWYKCTHFRLSPCIG